MNPTVDKPFVEFFEGVQVAEESEFVHVAGMCQVSIAGVSQALHELVVEGGELTKSLLGAGRAFASDRSRDDCD